MLGSDNLNAENIEKLEKEISLLRHLPQKRYFTNIVDVIDKDGRLNVVTETIRTPLSEVLKSHFPVGCSLKFASTIMSDVCRIVKKMHCAGVVHREIIQEVIGLRESKSGSFRAYKLGGFDCAQIL